MMKRNNKERGVGLNDEYVEGIFVSGEMQSQGIGKILLNYAKDALVNKFWTRNIKK